MIQHEDCLLSLVQWHKVTYQNSIYTFFSTSMEGSVLIVLSYSRICIIVFDLINEQSPDFSKEGHVADTDREQVHISTEVWDNLQ